MGCPSVMMNDRAFDSVVVNNYVHFCVTFKAI